MAQLNKKELILFLAIAVFLYSVQGCQASKQLGGEEALNSIYCINAATFPFSKQRVVEAINQTLPQLDFVISQTESNDTTITADRWSNQILKEELQESVDKQDRPSFLSGFVTFLGIVLLFGLVIMILSSPKDNQEESSPIISNNEDNNIIFNYRIFMDVEALNDSTTDVAIDILKTTYKSDSITESVYLENKYLNHSLIYGIDSCLRK